MLSWENQDNILTASAAQIAATNDIKVDSVVGSDDDSEGGIMVALEE